MYLVHTVECYDAFSSLSLSLKRFVFHHAMPQCLQKQTQRHRQMARNVKTYIFMQTHKTRLFWSSCGISRGCQVHLFDEVKISWLFPPTLGNALCWADVRLVGLTAKHMLQNHTKRTRNTLSETPDNQADLNPNPIPHFIKPKHNKAIAK